MSKSLKALLLSAFVYPGSGHFYLKKHVQGMLLAVVATVALYFLLSTTVEIAQGISDKILSGEIFADVVRITEEISMQSGSSDTLPINIATCTFFICWLISLIDSYRLGRREERNKRSSSKEI